MKQMKMFKEGPKAYGGDLLNTRKGRSHPRPLSTTHSMHLVLRSTKAVGDWSFMKPKNESRISKIVAKFSDRYGVKILSMANVGNHLHFHLKLTKRTTYRPFIRALTAAIAMAVTGKNRWSIAATKLKRSSIDLDTKVGDIKSERFWDYRPFTRIVQSLTAILNLRDYIQINRLEGYGYSRGQARYLVAETKTTGFS